jgi:hypothetical protein
MESLRGLGFVKATLCQGGSCVAGAAHEIGTKESSELMMRQSPARGFVLRVFSFVMVILIGMSTVFPVSATVPPAAPAELADESAAFVAARKFGKSVKIASRTTESSEVFANPDGTAKLATTLQPARVRRDNGWVPVDHTLHKKPSGVIAPAVTNVDLRLAGAGSGKQFVVLGRDGHEVGLDWTGPLPEPVLDHDAATYREVLPGVDLVVRVSTNGFNQLLVVKTPEAAKNPDLRKITFGSHTKGVRVTKANDGLEARDISGKLVFTGDASQMWDSSGNARQTTMDVSVTDDKIVIVPDQKFLTDPATRYPVSIDPSYYWPYGRKNHHVVVQSHPYGETRNYDRVTPPMNDLKAGLVPDENGLVSRSFVEMNIDGLGGKVIHNATLRLRAVHSHSCNGDFTDVYHTTGINTETRWNAQPWFPQHPHDGTRRTNHAQFCPSDGIADVWVTSAVQHEASKPEKTVTFGIRAKYEDRINDWRRFDLNPTLEVMYNSKPNDPTEYAMEGGLLPCTAGDKRAYVFTTTPRLRVRVTDPDGGLVTAHFVVHRGLAGGNGPKLTDLYRVDTPSGSFAEVQVPDGLLSEGIYTWAAVLEDGGETSNWIGGCDFEVDRTPPNESTVTSTQYPTSPSPGVPPPPSDGVGIAGSFLISSNGSTDVSHYLYSFSDQQNDDPKTRVNPSAFGVGIGPTAIVRWTPSKPGTQSMFVRSVDRAKNPSPIRKYQINVLPARGPVGHWKLDGDLGDSSGNDYSMTSVGGATVTAEGYSNQGGTFDGTDDHLGRPTTIDTSKDFSISAWVRLQSKPANTAGVVAVEGANTSRTYLQFDPASDQWVFGMTDSDLNGASGSIIGAPARLGSWTHLVGAYDAVGGKMTFYVNGIQQAANPTVRSWRALNDLVVGRQRLTNQSFGYLPGQVDEVRVFDRLISVAEAVTLNNQGVLRAHYALNEGMGTTTKDEVTGQLGTFSGGIEWDVDQYTAVKTVSGEVSAPEPTIASDRSYTVSAWVNLASAGSRNRGAVSLSPVSNQGTSLFDLRYSAREQNWGFSVSGPAGGVATSVANAVPGEMVHLVGVYDVPNRQVSLYLNGQFTGMVKDVVGGGHVQSKLVIGASLRSSFLHDYWGGLIDDVRVFSGALNDKEIARLAVRS